MDFHIADTFTNSLVKLAGNEQKAGKTTAFDLQLNPAQPGLRFRKLDRARDPNFWSVKAEINQEAWETLNSDTSRSFARPTSGRIAVKVINHLGDEVMKVFKVK